MDDPHPERRRGRTAQSSITTGLIFTAAFGAALAFTGIWAFIFPLVFAGVLPVMDGMRRLFADRQARRLSSTDVQAWEEKQVLRTARDEHGVVTPPLIAVKTELSLERAQAVLERLTGQGYAEMRVTDSGRIEYTFPEFLPGPPGDRLD